MSQIQLLKRVVVLFPRKEYTDPKAVRHNRRKLIDAISYLRNESSKGWVMDRSEEIQHAESSYLLCRQAG